jgi:hypothetical protein
VMELSTSTEPELFQPRLLCHVLRAWTSTDDVEDSVAEEEAASKHQEEQLFSGDSIDSLVRADTLGFEVRELQAESVDTIL